ncbi:hypothetical protein FF011L_40780 [Roseimaritima multifibrata]|uniref:DUF447 domain-containing protein n=1 Tax=Roseimaritima multifibrata TaxID=1930274 RepID=A0A517MK72_9BACT|nr:DUF447 domain-containing protein [Roseimaritima multifibrata]QDS95285.1 hypothetical protein FF011L_40780 [Roseimaritima multifibrata]
MILESLVTTVDATGKPHLAPLGPVVDRQFESFQLHPFVGTRTFANLQATGRAVVHVTDDSLLLARSAIGYVPAETLVEWVDIAGDRFPVLKDCCRWYALQMTDWEDHPQRPTVQSVILQQQRVRDFFGFNRAQSAVVEAAILATRVHLITDDVLRPQLQQLATLVERTGGDNEQQAFALLEKYIDQTASKREL